MNLVTICWFDHNDLPADDTSAYAELIGQIGVRAHGLGEAEDLRLALAIILSDPAVDCTAFDGSSYGFSSDEMRALIRQTYRQLWPDAPYPPAPPEGVELRDSITDA
ncbi:MAG TPA: hypothetical protein VD866_29145 [Urbifossiella sp.]|nr:hypothetical protein [Urbifossiella sp.]